MYVLFRKIDALAPNYDSCYQFQDKREAELKYQELLEQYPPRCLDLVELSEVQLVLTVDSNGNTSISNLEFPIATEEQMGIIRLATALQANWENPQNYVDGMPVSVPPTLIKEMIDAGIFNSMQYSTEYEPSVTTIKGALDDIYTQLNYIPLEITSFTADKTTFEIGSSNSVNFTWSYNKDIISQSLNGNLVANNLRQRTLYDISSPTEIILAATDDTQIVSASIQLIFTNRIYWGAHTLANTVDSAFVKSLSDSRLSTTVTGSYDFNCSTSEYAYIAYPASYGNHIPLIANWPTELVLEGTIEVNSDFSVPATLYNVYRTNQASLGTFTMEF